MKAYQITQSRTIRLLNAYRDALTEFASYSAMGIGDEEYEELEAEVKRRRRKLLAHIKQVTTS